MYSFYDSKIGFVNVFSKVELPSINPDSVFLGDSILLPGVKTTLNGFFDDFVEYLGIYDSYLQFKIGFSYDLFGCYIYCNSFKKIDDKCFVNIYHPGTARGYSFINGIWK